MNHQSWSEHFNLARNQSSYLADDQYPDFSPIGALVSNEIVGTATLIAPNLVVSAAHVVKNSLIDPMPDPEDWTFVLSENFESASTAQRLSISQIIVHPGWIARQTPSNRLETVIESASTFVWLFLMNLLVEFIPYPCLWGL